MAVLDHQSSSLQRSEQAVEESPLLSPCTTGKSSFDEAQFLKTALCVGFLTFVSGFEGVTKYFFISCRLTVGSQSRLSQLSGQPLEKSF